MVVIHNHKCLWHFQRVIKGLIWGVNSLKK
jgi:hypothetical protein